MIEDLSEEGVNTIDTTVKYELGVVDREEPIKAS